MKFAVLDHVISFPPVVMPIKELAALCHSEDCKVFVDGAHALASIPINLAELGVQYYASSMLKVYPSRSRTNFLICFHVF